MIYKIFRSDEWTEFDRAGSFAGSHDDLRDGFIHLSSLHQVAGTLATHFAGVEQLVLASVTETALGTDLRWEPSRNGALFPHLYRALHRSEIVEVQPLTCGPQGHDLPEHLA